MKKAVLKLPWLSWLLGGIFLLAGLSKLGRSELVFAGVMQYQLVDTHFAFWIADTLPWVEIALGIALWIRRSRGVALGLAFAIQLLFFATLAQATYRGLEISCVCFGTGNPIALWIQELVLLGVTLGALWHHRHPWRK